ECEHEGANENEQRRQPHKSCEPARQNTFTVAAARQTVPGKRECAVTPFLFRPNPTHRYALERPASQGVADVPKHPPEHLADNIAEEIDLQFSVCLTTWR